MPTDTASYADTQVPTEELAAAELRAWETGRTVLQVTPTGYSAVIGPDGQIGARTALDQAKVLYATVALRSGLTIYVRLGDDPFVALAVAALVVLWLSVRAGRSQGVERGAPAPPTAARTRNGLPQATGCPSWRARTDLQPNAVK